MLRHPLSAGEMAIKGAAGSLGITIGIDVQDDLRDLVPVGSFLISIKHPQIRDEVFFVVDGEHGIGVRTSAASGSIGGLCMGSPEVRHPDHRPASRRLRDGRKVDGERLS